MKHTKLFAFVLVTALLAVPATQALASGYNLAGTGSKGLAMGGAFRGIADDWSAVFWNPAGLAGQGNSIYLEGKLLMPTSSIESTGPFLNSGKIESEDAMFPAGAFGMTYMINEKMTVGLGVFAPTAAGATYKDLYFVDTEGTEAPEEDWDGMMTVIDIHPAIGYKINEQLSVGLGLSIKYGDVMFQSPSPFTMDGVNYFQIDGLMEGTGLGYGANIGVMYDITPKIHVGVSYSTAVDIAVSGNMTQTLYTISMGTVEAADIDAEADFPIPQEAGFGVAYDVNEKLTVAFDVMWTNWTAVDVVPIDLTGTDLSGVFTEMMGGTAGEAEDQELELNYEDVIRINLGAAYKFNEKLDLYAGFYYDPSAIPVEELDPAITDFVDKMNVSFGAKYMITPKIGAVGYYEYVFGKAREAETNPDGGNYAGWYDLTVGTISLGVTYIF